MAKEQSVLERFWSKVNMTTDGCWLWTGKLEKDGYARFWYKGKKVPAHRLVFMLMNRPVPKGMNVLHSCDVRHCVRHLFLGDSADNSADMVAKGRQARGPRCASVKYPGIRAGERNGRAKLDGPSVDQIRILFHSHSLNKSQLSRNFGISRSQIKKIVERKSWRDRS